MSSPASSAVLSSPEASAPVKVVSTSGNIKIITKREILVSLVKSVKEGVEALGDNLDEVDNVKLLDLVEAIKKHFDAFNDKNKEVLLEDALGAPEGDIASVIFASLMADMQRQQQRPLHRLRPFWLWLWPQGRTKRKASAAQLRMWNVRN